MSKDAAEAYRARFRKVLAFIDAHLHEDLSVERLSGVASFSKFHFHRQFSQLFAIGVYKYIQLVRLKRASYQLVFRSQDRIIDIALASRYESHEAFTRAFKKALGQTPSEFRERPAWDPWHATYQSLRELRIQHMTPDNRAVNVEIVDFPETRVAVLEHRGDPRLIEDSVRKFIAWRRQNKLPPQISKTFNIFYHDPAETPPGQYRMDLCAATDRAVAKNAFGVLDKTIPGGRCAVLRQVGSDDTLGTSIAYLYSTWLPSSGEEPRDFPPFAERVRFFPDVPEHEAVIDLFLPIR